jgi:hypothetical protein
MICPTVTVASRHAGCTSGQFFSLLVRLRSVVVHTEKYLGMLAFLAPTFFSARTPLDFLGRHLCGRLFTAINSLEARSLFIHALAQAL